MQVTYIMHVCGAHNGVPVEKHAINFIYGSSSFYILKTKETLHGCKIYTHKVNLMGTATAY